MVKSILCQNVTLKSTETFVLEVAVSIRMGLITFFVRQCGIRIKVILSMLRKACDIVILGLPWYAREIRSQQRDVSNFILVTDTRISNKTNSIRFCGMIN